MLVHEFSLRGAYAPLVSRWCLRRTPSRLGSARVSACWRLRRAIANFLRPFTAGGHRGRREVNDATTVRASACSVFSVVRICSNRKSEIFRIRNNLRVLEQKVNASDPPSPRLRRAKQSERSGQVRSATVYHALLRLAHHV